MKKQAIINLIKGSKAVILFAITTIALSSCKGTNDVIPYSQPANLNFINADTAALNIYQNGARLNNISSVSPGSQSGYISVTSGLQTYEIKKAGATNYIIDNVQLKLDSIGYYSIFAAGETADKVFLVNDAKPSAFTAGAGAIRFINASPVTTNLDVYVGSLSFLNQPFKTAGSFVAVAQGNTVVTIYQHGSTTPLFSNTANLSASTAYTLYTTGVPGGTGLSQFSAFLLIN